MNVSRFLAIALAGATACVLTTGCQTNDASGGSGARPAGASTSGTGAPPTTGATLGGNAGSAGTAPGTATSPSGSASAPAGGR